ncbi:hypothetical protein KJ865_15225, partial [Myxococcota bacterium]|nr:hypothetical protein [Myxococcota bacterium]
TLGGKNILVAGDVDFGSLSPFEEIASRFSIDVALLPVGGMREVAFYNKRHHKKNVHIDPETAWEIFTLLGAKTIIPIHWGAITVSKQPRDEAPLRLREIAGDKAGQCVTILYPGEGWSL